MDQLKPNAEPIVKKNVNFAPKGKPVAPVQKMASAENDEALAKLKQDLEEANAMIRSLQVAQ